MCKTSPFPARVYRVQRPDGRCRYVMTDRPYVDIDLGAYDADAPLPSVTLMAIERLTPMMAICLRVAIAFDALTMPRDGGTEFVSWIVSPDVRAICIHEAAELELAHFEASVVEADEFTVVEATPWHGQTALGKTTASVSP